MKLNKIRDFGTKFQILEMKSQDFEHFIKEIGEV